MTEAESRMLREVHGRLFGVTHQRHVKQADGGYRPAKLLDTKDGSYLVGLILANRFDENSLAELVANKVLAEATGGEVSVETVKQGVREVFAELAVAPE